MSDIEQATREWVERTLERLDMADWDRFVVGDDPNLRGRYIEVYGWIPRETDDYKDFVLVRFFPETESNLYGFTTSSDRYTEEIHRQMFDESLDEHNECRRVDETFNVENAIKLSNTDTDRREADTESGKPADCLESLNGFECHRSDGHDGSHQASAFENDGHYDLQLVEWWSIKPNGNPVEADTE